MNLALFRGLPDLLRAGMGGRALLCSDEFFASMHNLVLDPEPVWDAEHYTERGKWMDGWEPRRRRSPGQDWCILKLGVPGEAVGVNIDTRHFLGNAPPFGSLDGAVAPAEADGTWLRDQADWRPLLDEQPLERGGPNLFPLRPLPGLTHVRLNISFPAGGVARLRLYGRPTPPIEGARIDLASAAHGARTLACSDAFFSRMENLIDPAPPQNMGQGWETKRSPVPRQDWVIVELAAPGRLEMLDLDTAFFKGNHPTAAQVDGLFWPGAPPSLLARPDAPWRPVLDPVRLGPDRAHLHPARPGPWSHLRLLTHSDGGVARLRAWGWVERARPDEPSLSALREAPETALRERLHRACGSSRWVRAMLAARPFDSRQQLRGEAERLWWRLEEADWREAFAHHPRIGEDPAALRARFPATAALSEAEQAGVAGAAEETLRELAEANRAYEARFGHIFIVCARGLSAAQMLARLRERLDNEPAEELRVAAAEQLQITLLRLETP